MKEQAACRADEQTSGRPSNRQTKVKKSGEISEMEMSSTVPNSTMDGSAPAASH